VNSGLQRSPEKYRFGTNYLPASPFQICYSATTLATDGGSVVPLLEFPSEQIAAQAQFQEALAPFQNSVAIFALRQQEARRPLLEAQARLAAALLPTRRILEELSSTLRAPAPRRPSEPSVRPSPPADADVLADNIAACIRSEDYQSIRTLSERFRPQLEALGLIRSDSSPASCLRRFQEFCRRHVYGVRVPAQELPPLIRSGRETGGRRK